LLRTVHREAETQAWNKSGFNKLKDGERLLLWHGSRSTNFAGILSQGLRIAPPEGMG
jgi:poly [ADP-ribose] polymerase